MSKQSPAKGIRSLLNAYPEELRICAFNYCLVLAKAELGLVRLVRTSRAEHPAYLTYETDAGRFLVEIPEEHGPAEETLKATLVELLQSKDRAAS